MTDTDIQQDSSGSPTQDELSALYHISAATSRLTGIAFLREVVRQLAAVLGVKYAFVSVFTEDSAKMRVLTFWDGEKYVERGDVELQHTPCREVIKGSAFHCPSSLQLKFPDDEDAKSFGVESYRGVPLKGRASTHFGHLALADTKPMPEDPKFVKLMAIFAEQAAVELDRMESQKELVHTSRRLEAVVQSAMDAILTINESRIVTVFNDAAEEVFGVKRDEVLGREVDPYLSTELGMRLMQFMKSPGVDPNRPDHLWIPEGLSAVKSNSLEFPIEATVSRFIIDDEVYCTLILRDIGQRQLANERIDELLRTKDILSEQNQKPVALLNIVGSSQVIQGMKWHIDLVANTDSTVLIHGETGTGKELVARAVYEASDRHDRPLVSVNCAALPENLIESELFGHELGSFTGATARRKGRFELADQGTLFLDEIGELPLHLQPKLLRVLQQQEFQRLGGSKTITVDVRIIAASNRDLEAMVAKGEFREDLYYRLSVFPVRIPPLRERQEDIATLAQYFIDQYSRKIGRPAREIESESLQRMMDYPWPGNVRELENVIERSVILSTGPTVTVDLVLPASAMSNTPIPQLRAPSKPAMTLEEVEREHILHVLDYTRGVVEGPNGAAKLLNINPSTLRSRMRKLSIAWSQ